MAVERISEFVLDLGDLVKTRLESFSNSRKNIQATIEADFQRQIVDNDLSWQDQLDYRQKQIKEEEAKIYPDVAFVDTLKSVTTELKKLVRARKFRDKHFAILQDIATGRKSLEEYLEFLEGSLGQARDIKVRDQIEDLVLKATEAKRVMEKQMIDSQIAFYKKDKTQKSLQKAIDLVKAELLKPETQKNPEILNAYQLNLRTLEKEKLEVETEDKFNWMAMQLIEKDIKNPSLWKLEAFSGLRDKAGLDLPVNIGGVRYNSEQEYWQTTLNSYIQGKFAGEYAKENETKATLLYNQLGFLPDTYLQTLGTGNNLLKNNPDLQLFPQVISAAIQDSITKTLDLKAQELTAKYYLDKPAIATEQDIQSAKSELENLKIFFGEDYSLSPAIQQIETILISKRVETTKDVLRVVGDVMADPEAYGESLDITWEEVFKKYGPGAAVEIPAETFKKKPPIEVAEEVVEVGKKAPELITRKEELEKQIEETKKRIEEEKAGKVTPPTPEETKVEEPKLIIHTVTKGETLWGIASRFLGSGARWKELKTPEGVAFTEETARKLQIGQKLIIPSK